MADKRLNVVNGYIREHFTSEEVESEKNYPIELNKVISEYLGNLFLRFDTAHNYFKHLIKNDGLMVNTTQFNPDGCKDFSNGYSIACSYGIIPGMVELLEIKCIKAGRQAAIGVTTNLEASKTASIQEWITSQDGYKYWWYRETSIYAEHNTGDIHEPIRLNGGDCGWDDNDVIGFNVDCNEWKITFYKNNKALGSFPLRRNMDYYVFIAFNQYTNDSVYQLLM